MKKTTEQLFCDICGKEFKYSEYRWIKTGGSGCGCLREWPAVCATCHDKVDSFIDSLWEGR